MADILCVQALLFVGRGSQSSTNDVLDLVSPETASHAQGVSQELCTWHIFAHEVGIRGHDARASR